MEKCDFKTKKPTHTDPPECIKMVVLTALKDNIQQGSAIGGLGAGELSVGTSRYALASPSDFSEYSFIKDGVEAVKFTKKEKELLNAIRKISATLPRPVPDGDYPAYLKVFTQFTPKEHFEMQRAIDYLANIVKKWYSKTTGKHNIVVIPSRNIVPRAAGAEIKPGVIPGNPMMHLDYLTFSDAYNAQCNIEMQQEWNDLLSQYGVPKSRVNDCSSYALKDLVDVVNVWFPTYEVEDWPLAFIPDLVEPKFTKVQIISGSIAASVPLKTIPAEATISYMENMKWGDAYFFRAVNGPKNKKGVLHGSIKITKEKHIRRSFECRMMIFKKKITKK